VIAYLDSSILLRVVLGEPGRLEEWPRLAGGVSSALAEVECLRTLDRLVLRGALAATDAVERRAAIYALLEAVELVELSAGVLARAAQPFPVPLGTLDALHLATALLWRERGEPALAFATHDLALGQAARASGFLVLGDAPPAG
jgi:predicted nucleic acid-binding protein